jgi:hypothetical protein
VSRPITFLFFMFLLLAGHCLHAMMAEVVPKSVNLEDIVKKVIEEEGESADPDYISYLRETIPAYDKKLSTIEKSFPRYEVAGNVDYFMTIDETRRAVTEKFGDMYREGNIMTTEQFNAMIQAKWYKISDPDLTRIWGAQYLSKQFEIGKKKDPLRYNFFKTPRYILVVEDLGDIQIEIHWGQCYPIVARLLNGTIYAERVEGERVTGEDVGFGFTDTKKGNVLRTKENIDYVVDTEHKSFHDNLHGQYLHKMKFRKADPAVLCPFLRTRFGFVNGLDMSKPYVIGVKIRNQ